MSLNDRTQERKYGEPQRPYQGGGWRAVRDLSLLFLGVAIVSTGVYFGARELLAMQTAYMDREQTRKIDTLRVLVESSPEGPEREAIKTQMRELVYKDGLDPRQNPRN